jgi:flagellar basal-body rod protein FlgB
VSAAPGKPAFSDSGKSLPPGQRRPAAACSAAPSQASKWPKKRQSAHGMQVARKAYTKRVLRQLCRQTGISTESNGERMNIIGNTFSLHEKALGMRSQRMEVLSRNIANADTPNFKAQDIDFRQVLKDTQDTTMRTTDAAHIPMGDIANGSGLKYRTPFNVAFDGNTVELPVEQAKFGQYAAEYQTTLSILESRISGIRKALRGD